MSKPVPAFPGFIGNEGSEAKGKSLRNYQVANGKPSEGKIGRVNASEPLMRPRYLSLSVSD